jgi:hypothetical protein
MDTIRELRKLGANHIKTDTIEIKFNEVHDTKTMREVGNSSSIVDEFDKIYDEIGNI